MRNTRMQAISFHVQISTHKKTNPSLSSMFLCLFPPSLPPNPKNTLPSKILNIIPPPPPSLIHVLFVALVAFVRFGLCFE